MKRRSLAPIVVSLILAACSPKTSYGSLAELNSEQAKLGFIPVGEFGKHWPSEKVGEVSAMNEISFTLEKTPHNYSGFTGYELKVIRFKNSAGKESAYLFRSKEKRD